MEVRTLSDNTHQYIAKTLNPPNPSEAISMAKSFLENLSSFPNDIDENKTTTSLHTIENFTLIPAENGSITQVIKVYFFQKNINGLPIYYETPFSSTISLSISAGTNPKVVEASYYHRFISQESATYPIKTAKQAFSELQKGKAYMPSHTKGNNNILIRNAALGYYLGKENQEHLMPVIIFQGDNDFFAYVPALKDEWVKK